MLSANSEYTKSSDEGACCVSGWHFILLVLTYQAKLDVMREALLCSCQHGSGDRKCEEGGQDPDVGCQSTSQKPVLLGMGRESPLLAEVSGEERNCWHSSRFRSEEVDTSFFPPPAPKRGTQNMNSQTSADFTRAKLGRVSFLLVRSLGLSLIDWTGV